MVITWKRCKLTLALAALAAGVGCSRKTDTQLIESAKQFMAKKDYARAVVQLRAAIQANPKNAEAQYQLAQAEIGRGDRVAAYRALTKALDLDPKHAGAQLAMANVLAASDNPNDLRLAQEHARAVLSITPENPDALDAMAFAELKLGNQEEAVKLLEEAGSKAPEHLQTIAMLVSTRLATGDKAGAEQILKDAVQKAPGSIEARVMLSSFYLLVGKYPEGEQELRKVLEKDPNNALALLDLATLFNASGRKNEAEEAFRRLATQQPASPYQYAYGSYLFRIGKTKESVAEFERLAKLNSKDINARTRLVSAYLATKRVPDAQKILTAALKKNPKDTAALIQQVDLNLLVGNYQDARKDLNQVLNFNPRSAKAHYLMARLEKTEGFPVTERQELAETLRLDDHFFAARVELARLYIAQREASTALQLMKNTPADQQNTVGFLENQNWAWLATGDLKDLRKGIDQGLAKVRTRDLLLQDALLKLQQKNDSGARASLLEILNKNPEDSAAVEVLVRNYAVRKQYSDAIGQVRSLLSRKPQSALLQYHLGTLLAMTGQRNEARSAFESAVVADPRFAAPRVAIALMDQAEGKTEAARQILDPLLASKATELAGRMQLGILEAKAGNYAKAIDHLRKVVAGEPQNVIALNDLAYLLAEHTNATDEALKCAQKAQELAPNDVTVEGTIGWVYFKKGMYGFALQHLQRAVNREGVKVIDGTAVRRYHLAMAYEQAGEKEKAAKTLTAALKLNPNLPEAAIARQMVGESK